MFTKKANLVSPRRSRRRRCVAISLGELIVSRLSDHTRVWVRPVFSTAQIFCITIFSRNLWTAISLWMCI